MPPDKLFGLPGGCNGDVHALIEAPNGLLYLGGTFTICDDVPASGIAVYNPLTRRYSSVGSSVGEGVSIAGDGFARVGALAIVGDDLYAGGSFDHAGGVAARNLARWDGVTWAPVGAGVGGVDDFVGALAVSGSDLYVGGRFRSVGGLIANNIARWSGDAWSALGVGAANGVADDVLALAVSGADVYAGGRFLLAGGGILANYVARWNGSAWSALDNGVTGSAQFQTFPHVAALAVVDGQLYVGGNFLAAGGQTVNGIARWNGSAWSRLGNGVVATNSAQREVSTIAAVGSSIYVGGAFTHAGGRPANHVARWNGSEWSSLDSGIANGINFGEYSQVFALARSGTGVYVGGRFHYAGGQPALGVAEWSGDAWRSLGADARNGVYSGGENGIYNRVDAVAVSGDSVYVGGAFTRAGGLTVNRIARWNGSIWSALGNGVDGDVYALAATGNDVYVGGFLTRAGGLGANGIARWSAGAWFPLGTGVRDRGAAGFVAALAAVNADLYVGGAFDEAGGQPARNIARWNGTAWSSLAGGVSSQVRAIVALGSDLYVGGDFTEAGGLTVNGIARWDGTSWSAVGPAGASGVNGSVQALAVLDGNLYVGGLFDRAGGQAAQGIARWNGSAWSALGEGVDGSADALAVLGTDLYALGNFNRAGGQPVDAFARWNGSEWQGVSQGVVPRAQGFSLPADLDADGVSLYAGALGLLQTPLPVLESRSLTGLVGNAPSGTPSISRNGESLAFASAATDLAAGNGNGRSDIFLRRLPGARLDRISDFAFLANGGVAESFSDPSISSDGARIAFSGSSGQIYVYTDSRAQIVSRNADGAVGNGPSRAARLPGSGRLAVFESQATNLVPTDSNGPVSDVFLADLATGGLTLISRGAAGEPANGASSAPSASDDGGIVAFSTLATNLVPGVSGAADGHQIVWLGGASRGYVSRSLHSGELGNGDSAHVRITPDGRYGVFESDADNLVPGDSNGVRDVFRFELAASGVTRLDRVSISRFGYQGNGASRNPTISEDGRFIAFETDASNLIELDRNRSTDILVKWMETGEVVRLSRTAAGVQPDGSSGEPAISADGAVVAFSSFARNLVAGDANGVADVHSVRVREPTRAAVLDEPALSRFALPTPDPPNANCPSGFFAAVVDDGPGQGLVAGAFGMEVLLDEPGSRVLAGGLNFGGLIDLGQVGFAGFSIQNANNEAQRVDLSLTGSPASSAAASFPVRVRISRRMATTSDSVFEATPSVSLAEPYRASVEVAPGFYEVTVSPMSGAAGGAAEGQFYFSLTTRFVDRPGGGFQGGAVVGGYHATHPFGGVSGFAAFCLATPHSTSVRVLAQPSYGISGARDLRLRIQDAAQRDLVIVPGD